MTRDPKSEWRGPALLVLAAATLLGLYGTWVASLGVLFAVSDFEEGRRAGLGFIIFYGALLICPLTGWAAFAVRRYRIAVMIASPPLLLTIISALLTILS